MSDTLDAVAAQAEGAAPSRRPPRAASPIEPVTLTGRHVELVPMERGHRDALAEAVRDGELWRLLVHGHPFAG